MIISDACGVLVVEADPFLRFAAMGLVEDAGLSGYAAAHSTKAFTVLTSHNDIGIMFTNIEMPGPLNGLELAKIVRRRWPHIAIIVASGASNVAANSLPTGTTFIAKPYLPEAVIAFLKEAASSDRWDAAQLDPPNHA
ncbi:Blue-light-activated protein (plasmid) [Sulfitobacter indolifex]|uniref:response regulator n=1 Tax=Sulfitobacter indolifex TaxID=225422 RepID=UPI001FACA7D3|nr:response regulator [Sulfitobacter indolifex]UOA21304.1 Blue-light-activated protein [Sulfitobacter indolifex]